MRTKAPATLADVYKVEGQAECVNGELVELPPAGEALGRRGFSITPLVKIVRGQDVLTRLTVPASPAYTLAPTESGE
jgi:hypothetical protein